MAMLRRFVLTFDIPDRGGAPTPRLTMQWLDLDDKGARFGEQQARIGTLEDLAEIDHGHIR